MTNRQTFHPVHQVYDGVFNTRRGKVDLYNPHPDQIHIEDIAAALAKICRFGGHVKRFYSVAQHCCLVANLVPAPLMLEALLHDATEAYCGDVIKPLKVLLGKVYEEIEARFKAPIVDKFSLYNTDDVKAILKRADMQAVELECEAFQRGNRRPLQQIIRRHRLLDDFGWCWSPDEAEARFLTMYEIVNRPKK